MNAFSDVILLNSLSANSLDPVVVKFHESFGFKSDKTLHQLFFSIYTQSNLAQLNSIKMISDILLNLLIAIIVIMNFDIKIHKRIAN